LGALGEVGVVTTEGGNVNVAVKVAGVLRLTFVGTVGASVKAVDNTDTGCVVVELPKFPSVSVKRAVTMALPCAGSVPVHVAVKFEIVTGPQIVVPFELKVMFPVRLLADGVTVAVRVIF
jgi:hypothetical protein